MKPPRQEATGPEGLHAQIIHSAPEGIGALDTNLRFAVWNSFLEELSGLSATQVLGKPLEEVFPGWRGTEAASMLRQALAGQVVALPYVRTGEWLPSGRRTWVSGKLQPFRDPQGTVIGVAAFIWEAAKRREIEAALREEASFVKGVIERAAEGLCVCHAIPEYPHVAFTVWNQRMTEITGYTMEEINRRGWYQSVYPDLELQARAVERMQRMRQGDDLRAEEWEITRADGAKRTLSISTSILVSADGLAHVLALMHDVTERKQGLEALQESQARLQAAQRIAHIGSWEARLLSLEDFSQNPLRWSEEVFRIFGYEPGQVQVTHQLFSDAVHPDDRPRVWAEVRQAILEHRRYQCEHRIVRPDGGERIVLEHAEPELDPATGRPVRFRGTVQDITERKRLEQELNEVRKMEALGHLASGVAHDFNNLLTVIQGHASLLEEQPTPNAEAADSWSQIRHAVERATRLTHQLATFSRRHPLPQSVLDFNSLVGQVARTVRSLLRQDIKLDCACAVGLPSVEGDPSLLEQVIKNLVLNAQDAMPVGGCLSIRTDRVVVDAQGAGRHPAARVGEFVCLSVQDTGGGIGPEVLPRIFEPFFTTKNGGVGTGLGLASAYAIVHRHRGWIEVETQLGSGTTVKVFLPAKPTVAPLPARPEGPVRARVGAGVILVVEDEEPLRVFVTLYLQRRGYTVVAAAGATPALEIWEREKDRVELLLTDVVMPGGMNGFELAQALLREKPSLKVLYTSGYTEQISGGPLLQEGANFLRKPYDANRLLTGVRRWLEAP